MHGFPPWSGEEGGASVFRSRLLHCAHPPIQMVCAHTRCLSPSSCEERRNGYQGQPLLSFCMSPRALIPSWLLGFALSVMNLSFHYLYHLFTLNFHFLTPCIQTAKMLKRVPLQSLLEQTELQKSRVCCSDCSLPCNPGNTRAASPGAPS